jgi:photosystem II stability/assembly factor-like uncharacterized protein
MKKHYLSALLLCFNFLLLNAQTWTQINTPTPEDIAAVSFINENTGWIIGNNSVYKTTDGGTTWTPQVLPPTPQYMSRSYNSINFIDENTGIIGCTNFITDYPNHDPSQISVIIWTNDGGTTWEYKNVGNNNSYNSDALLVTPQIAYTIGQYGQSYKTTDGGASWIECTFSSFGYSGKRLFAVNENAVYFAGLQNLSLIGSYGKMSNGNWTVAQISNNTSMNCLYYFDADSGIIGGNDGEILVTLNGGNNWSTAVTPVTSSIRGISFKNMLEGWACTSDGKILKSIDGGLNWSIEYDGTVFLRNIVIKNLNGYGYAVGNDGTLLKYNSNLSTEKFEKDTLYLYPNPANQSVNIKFNEMTTDNAQITVTNSLGQVVQKSTIGSQTLHTLDTSGFSNGIYFINLTQNGRQFVGKKLIISH